MKSELIYATVRQCSSHRDLEECMWIYRRNADFRRRPVPTPEKKNVFQTFIINQVVNIAAPAVSLYLLTFEILFRDNIEDVLNCVTCKFGILLSSFFQL